MDFYCDECGYEEWFEDEGDAEGVGWEFEPDTEHWHCPDCAGQHPYCQDCGSRIEGTPYPLLIQGDHGISIYCENCVKKYIKCPRCNKHFLKPHKTHMVMLQDIEGETAYLCSNCRGELQGQDQIFQVAFTTPDNINNIRRYTNQMEHSDNNHIFQIQLDPNYQERCPNCMREMEPCVDCTKRKAEYKEAEETTLWVYDTAVKEYHDSDHNRFKRMLYREHHEKPFLYYGMEIELLFDTSENIHEIAKAFIKATNGMFVAEFDRSITNQGNGCEFISRPMSFKRWTSKETYELLKKGMEAIKKYNPYEPQPELAGIHVHMSRAFFEHNTEKSLNKIRSDIDWIFQVFQEEIEKLSDRKYTMYCASKAFKIKEILNNTNATRLLTGKINLRKANIYTEHDNLSRDHHDAITLQDRTIEVRTFRSTTDVDKIISIIELCRSIAHSARNLELTDTTTFGDVIFAKDSEKLPVIVDKAKINIGKEFGQDIEVEL